MKTLMVTTGLSLVFLVGSAPATAQSLSFDLPYTNACFEAASVKDRTSRGIQQCNAAIARETLTSGDNRAANLVNRGILQLVANNMSAAGRDFDEALSLDQTQAEAWLGKAIERWQSGNDADAVTIATRALQYRPKRPAVAHLVRGLAYERQGQLREAYADLTAAQQLEPGWSEPAEQLRRYKVVQR